MTDVQFSAFADELIKIAEETKGKRLKSWLKNTALIGAGTAGGVGVGMLTEKAVGALVGPAWAKLSPPTKLNIHRGVSGLVGAATVMATERFFRQHGQASGKEKASQP